MITKYYKLIISTEVVGLENKREDYVYMKSSLVNIDEYTLRYASEEDFLKENRAKITHAVKREYTSTMGFPPIDVFPTSVYIREEEHEM